MKMRVKLSRHFTSNEFACSHCGIFQVDMRLVNALEELREVVGRPLVITSGYRCAEHNRAVGGAQASEHVRGLAADVACPRGVDLVDFFAAAISIPALKGVGVYPAENFLHVDVREKQARWGRVGGAYVSAAEALKVATKKRGGRRG